MAKLKKGSEAAKAWGRKMKALRTSKSKGNINKPVRVRRSRKLMSRKKEYHRKHKSEIHVIPDLFYASAAAIPFVTTTPESQTSAVDSLMMPGAPIGERVANFANASTQGAIQNIVPIAELAVIGWAARVLGKKLGLNRIGTKEVKLA